MKTIVDSILTVFAAVLREHFPLVSICSTIFVPSLKLLLILLIENLNYSITLWFSQYPEEEDICDKKLIRQLGYYNWYLDSMCEAEKMLEVKSMDKERAYSNGVVSTIHNVIFGFHHFRFKAQYWSTPKGRRWRR